MHLVTEDSRLHWDLTNMDIDKLAGDLSCRSCNFLTLSTVKSSFLQSENVLKIYVALHILVLQYVVHNFRRYF